MITAFIQRRGKQLEKGLRMHPSILTKPSAVKYSMRTNSSSQLLWKQPVDYCNIWENVLVLLKYKDSVHKISKLISCWIKIINVRFNKKTKKQWSWFFCNMSHISDVYQNKNRIQLSLWFCKTDLCTVYNVKPWPCKEEVCMLTIRSINVKGFIHGVHRYANAQSFSVLETKLVAFMVIFVFIFALHIDYI